ncbi:MAG: hypothetical protein KatS3mg035_0768 [Bacteroidia bacterium]|nr:MAG: hypothetical protein KatS3mg035_0768 [Bacteroidia bacterium]
MSNKYLWLSWAGLTFIYGINFFFLRYQKILFFSHYFNDLIALPWTFAFITLIYRYIFKVQQYQVSIFQMIFTWMSFSWIFEGILPYFYPHRYYADLIDVWMYFLGTVIWWYINYSRKT